LAIALSVMGSVASFAETYPTKADRQTRAEVLDSPAAQLFIGPGYGMDNYSFGAMTANEMLPMTAVAVALMSVFLVIRHTRAEEERGTAELVRAAPVGRLAPMAATLAVVVGAQLVLAALLTVGLPASLEGLSAGGSFAFSAATAGIGVVFAGLAAVAAQLTVGARSAVGLSSVALAGAYLLRSVGDTTDTPLTWFSPFGWATEMRAYVDERWWPLLVSAGLATGAVAVAVTIARGRDLGFGVIADRSGRANAPRGLGSPFGLALRLQRATLAWWGVSLFLLGLLYGAIAQEAATLYEDNEALEDFLVRVGAADPADQYLALTASISALMVAGYAIQSALRARGEESALRAEPVLATPVDRRRWLGSHLAMALGGSVVLLFAFGLGTGIARSASTGDAGELPRLIGAALAYAPALWVFCGVAAALFGFVPRAASVTWGFLALVVLINILGPLLQLPDWSYDLSPLEHVPTLPVADFSVVPELILTALAAALVSVGLVSFRRRDLLT
jgi:ABC-2 type transport system permease protein